VVAAQGRGGREHPRVAQRQARAAGPAHRRAGDVDPVGIDAVALADAVHDLEHVALAEGPVVRRAEALGGHGEHRGAGRGLRVARLPPPVLVLGERDAEQGLEDAHRLAAQAVEGHHQPEAPVAALLPGRRDVERVGVEPPVHRGAVAPALEPAPLVRVGVLAPGHGRGAAPGLAELALEVAPIAVARLDQGLQVIDAPGDALQAGPRERCVLRGAGQVRRRRRESVEIPGPHAQVGLEPPAVQIDGQRRRLGFASHLQPDRVPEGLVLVRGADSEIHRGRCAGTGHGHSGRPVLARGQPAGKGEPAVDHGGPPGEIDPALQLEGRASGQESPQSPARAGEDDPQAPGSAVPLVREADPESERARAGAPGADQERRVPGGQLRGDQVQIRRPGARSLAPQHGPSGEAHLDPVVAAEGDSDRASPVGA
jgi:hypothetical protein